MEELNDPDLTAAAAAIEAFLRALGHDPARDPELAHTGRLVAEAFHNDMLSGYAMDPAAILSQPVHSQDSEMVVVRDIETICVCPHHLMPAQGRVHLGYVPDGRIAGLGALARVVDCFSRRLVLQETLVQQVAEALVEHLGAKAAGCVADLSPACMTARGERRHAARALSVGTAGAMRDDASLKASFLSLCGQAATA